MDTTPAESPTGLLAELMRHQARQGDALERVAGSMASMANEMWSVASGAIKIALVHPSPGDASIVCAVLLRNATDERRLERSLRRFESAPPETTVEAWLESESFRTVDFSELCAATRTEAARTKAAVVTPGFFSSVADLKVELDDPRLA